MPVKAITPDYRGDIRDRRENFGGNIIVYVGWDEHLLFCAAKTFPLPPDMPFQALREQVLAEGFGQHPDFEHIKWEKNILSISANPTNETSFNGLSSPGDRRPAKTELKKLSN